MPRVTFIDRGGVRHELEASIGQSLMVTGRDAGLDIEGACEGCMACSTCHLIVDPAWYPQLGVPDDDEEDMLDLAYGVTSTSRLGCQLIVIEEFDGLVVSLPAATRNLLVG